MKAVLFGLAVVTLSFAACTVVDGAIALINRAARRWRF